MIVELQHVAVAVATLTAPGDTFEYRVELVDARTDETLLSLRPVAALELGRRLVARAKAASR